MVIDVAAGAATQLGVARGAQIVIIDIAATAAALPRIAIGPLIVVVDVPATGERVTAEHQQHGE
jgi:hypothetical protein